MDEDYVERYIKLLKGKSDSRLSYIINRIYEDGFQDGFKEGKEEK